MTQEEHFVAALTTLAEPLVAEGVIAASEHLQPGPMIALEVRAHFCQAVARHVVRAFYQALDKNPAAGVMIPAFIAQMERELALLRLARQREQKPEQQQ